MRLVARCFTDGFTTSIWPTCSEGLDRRFFYELATSRVYVQL